MNNKWKLILIKIAGWYDIILGIIVFTISRLVFDFFNIEYPKGPFLFASGLFVIAYGYLLLSIPNTDPVFSKIASSSSFVRIGFFFIILIKFILHSEFELGYFILALLDLITGILLLLAIKSS